MGTFDFCYTVEMKEITFTKQNKNTLIDKNMAYILDGDRKYDII